MPASWLLLVFALSSSDPTGGVVPVAADEAAADEDAASEETAGEEEAVSEEAASEEASSDEPAEDAEPFPWDMVAGALVMSGGLAAGAGLTAAGIGALFLTAPDADPVIAPGGYVLLGAGAIVGLVGVVVVSTGGGILLFTGDDE